MTTKLDKQKLIEEAKETLKKLFPVGAEVYLIVTKDNEQSSWINVMGPLRDKDGSIVIKDNNIDPRFPEKWVGILLSIRAEPCKGVLVQGYGSNRAHELAYKLSMALYGSGNAIKPRVMG